MVYVDLDADRPGGVVEPVSAARTLLLVAYDSAAVSFDTPIIRTDTADRHPVGCRARHLARVVSGPQYR